MKLLAQQTLNYAAARLTTGGGRSDAAWLARSSSSCSRERRDRGSGGMQDLFNNAASLTAWRICPDWMLPLKLSEQMRITKEAAYRIPVE